MGKKWTSGPFYGKPEVAMAKILTFDLSISRSDYKPMGSRKFKSEIFGQKNSENFSKYSWVCSERLSKQYIRRVVASSRKHQRVPADAAKPGKDSEGSPRVLVGTWALALVSR